MTRALLLHDRLAPPDNHSAYVEVLDARPHEGCIKIFDAANLQDRYVEVERLVADLHAGRLTVLRPGKPSVSLAMQPHDHALHERNAFIQTVMQRIRTLQKQCGISFLKAYRYAAEEYQERATPHSPPFPPQSTMYRYRKAAKADLPVLRGNKNKGNRKPRYPQEVIDKICMLAEQHYLVSQSRWTLKDLTKAVNRLVVGTLLPGDSPEISNKFVRRTIAQFLSADESHARMLPHDAIAGKSVARVRIRAEAPFERVEQDAVHLPFVVQTPTGVSSQIWLVHAIDCCTSYPLGWTLSVGSLTDTETLACVEMFMSPSKARHFKRLGINHTMNVCGTPGQLVFDNGPETKGARIQNLERLGVDVKHCRARAGHEKPFIERLNRSLKEDLQTLSGCTRLDGKDGQRDPVALGDKLMTLEELERWIVRWYYEKWIHSPLERLSWGVLLKSSVKGDTPAQRWKHFEDECFAISLPPSRTEWLAALYEHAERRLNRKTGITIEGLHYKGPELGALIARHGEQQPLRVLFNPDDFRYVYLYEGDDLPLVMLAHEHLRPETPAWSVREAKEHLKRLESELKTTPEVERFEWDLHTQSVADSLGGKRKKRSKREQNRDTALLAKAERAVQRASAQPTPQPPPLLSGKPIPRSTQKADGVATSSLPEETTLLPVLARDSGRTL